MIERTSHFRRNDVGNYRLGRGIATGQTALPDRPTVDERMPAEGFALSSRRNAMSRPSFRIPRPITRVAGLSAETMIVSIETVTSVWSDTRPSSVRAGPPAARPAA